MNREEILKKIEEVRQELEADQFQIMTEKILQKGFHLHKSQRGWLKRRMIEKARKRLILEISLMIDPILENQKEINLRFLREIDSLKKSVAELENKEMRRDDRTQNQENSPESEK